MMAENQTDIIVTELTCEEPDERIFSISFYYLIPITILSFLLTVFLFLFTVISAKEKVKSRNKTKNKSRNIPKVVQFADIDAIDEQEEDNSSTNVTDPEDLYLYELIPKYYSNESIQMNINAINEKRLSETSGSSKHNHHVEALAKQLFSRSKSDEYAKFALRNALRTRDDIRQINMGGGDGKTPWPESDARRRNSTWAGSED